MYSFVVGLGGVVDPGSMEAHVDMYTCVIPCVHTRKSGNKTQESFSFLSVWVLRTELRLSHLVASALTHGAIPQSMPICTEIFLVPWLF